MDKGGGCAVLGVLRSLALLRPKINVVAALSVAENAIGSHAVKVSQANTAAHGSASPPHYPVLRSSIPPLFTSVQPHAILTTVKGSVEVGNTDAEGRLVMADTFTYLQRHYSPQTIVDIATLTGACVIALGDHLGGVFSNDSALPHRLIEAGQRAAEEFWHLPIHSTHRDSLKTTYADFRSTGKSRAGGASNAAAFLEKFIDDGVRWAHCDIAGPAMLSEASEWRCKKGTAFGMQTLLEFVLMEADRRGQERKPDANGTQLGHAGGEGGIERALAS